MNPYSVLGVRRNASFATIKAAYRERARTAHPDAGGSDEAFHEVNLAWEVLGDQKRRARYDRTGEVEDDGPDNAEGVAKQILAQALDAALQQVARHGADALQQDMVALMRRQIDEQIEAQRRDIAQAEESLAFHQKLVGRFVRLDGCTSPIEGFLVYKLFLIDDGLKQARQSEAAFVAARAMLDDHQFLREHQHRSGAGALQFFDISMNTVRP